MISAKMITDSICPRGNRLRTLEVVMPRYILAEFNTHRMLSKNSASSRAIPLSKMIKSVEENPFIPYAWQKSHSGMQGTEYITDEQEISNNCANRLKHIKNVIDYVKIEDANGITKQLANRLLEPFMYHKVLVSGTEWDNFFNLRCPQYTLNNDDIFKSRKDFKAFYKEATEVVENHLALPLFAKDTDIVAWLKTNNGQADIHMMFLAEAIWDATNESTPVELKEGEWHIPYGDNIDEGELHLYLFKNKLGKPYQTLEDVKCQISIARCARLSYQTLGDNPVIDYEKDLALYESLSTSGHWSPFEHVARVMTEDEYNHNTILVNLKNTPVPVENFGWCRNYRGFIQYRALLDN